LNQLLRRAGKDDVAVSVASFSGTPVEAIRAAVAEMEAAHPAHTSPSEPTGLVALC
jgi:hypothetical protein